MVRPAEAGGGLEVGQQVVPVDEEGEGEEDEEDIAALEAEMSAAAEIEAMIEAAGINATLADTALNNSEADQEESGTANK